jgi:hypothetical protein
LSRGAIAISVGVLSSTKRLGNTVNPQALSRTPYRFRTAALLKFDAVVDEVAHRALTTANELFMCHVVSVEHPDPRGSDAPQCRVLLVVQDPARHHVMQRCVRENLPGCRIDVVTSYFDAMARASRMETHMLVLDLSMDSLLVPALKRFLARAAPQALVHVFDDSMDDAPGAGTDCQRPSIVQLKQAFVALSASPFPSH